MFIIIWLDSELLQVLVLSFLFVFQVIYCTISRIFRFPFFSLFYFFYKSKKNLDIKSNPFLFYLVLLLLLRSFQIHLPPLLYNFFSLYYVAELFFLLSILHKEFLLFYRRFFSLLFNFHVIFRFFLNPKSIII